MFLTDLQTCMNADTSVNALVDGGIVFEHLPVNFDVKKYWVVYSYSATGMTDVMGAKRVLSEFNVLVQIIGPSIVKVIEIADLLDEHLINYYESGIVDVVLTSDDLDLDTEKAVYFKTQNFTFDYRKIE